MTKFIQGDEVRLKPGHRFEPLTNEGGTLKVIRVETIEPRNGLPEFSAVLCRGAFGDFFLDPEEIEQANPKPVFIGIGGKLAAGKDTVADYLVANHGFVKIGMSDPLHKAMLTLNPLVDWTEDFDQITYAGATRDFGYTDAKANFPEYRRLLQAFGTEVGRQLFGEDVWVDLARKRALELLSQGKSVILTGIRFQNELQMVQGQLGDTWWVTRRDPQTLEPLATFDKSAIHASENGVSEADFDRSLVNIALPDLYSTVDFMLETMP